MGPQDCGILPEYERHEPVKAHGDEKRKNDRFYGDLLVAFHVARRGLDQRGDAGFPTGGLSVVGLAGQWKEGSFQRRTSKAASESADLY